jgi:hypothetical protein
MKGVNEKKKQEAKDSPEKHPKKLLTTIFQTKIKGKPALKKNWNLKKKEEKNQAGF